MSTQQQRRRAIADGMAASRAATGADSRQAIRDSLVTSRRGSQIAADLNQLQQAVRPRKTLRTVPAVGAVPAARGRASYVPPTAAGGGMASPLTEMDYGQRTFHGTQYFGTSDGIFVFELSPPSRIVMTDANGDTHPFNYAEPT